MMIRKASKLGIMPKQLLLLLIALSFTCTLAQTELEFAPPADVNASPGVLRETRNVLQQRLEHFLEPGQRFNVSLSSGKILVRLESSDVDMNEVIALCTAIGKLEFIDSETALEEGKTYAGAGRVIFTDRDIRTTAASMSEFGTAVVELELSSEGGGKLATYSKNNVGNFLVIVKDGQVVSSPKIVGEIPDAKVWLSGNFTLEETQRLAAELAGRLPVPLELVRQN